MLDDPRMALLNQAPPEWLGALLLRLGPAVFPDFKGRDVRVALRLEDHDQTRDVVYLVTNDAIKVDQDGGDAPPDFLIVLSAGIIALMPPNDGADVGAATPKHLPEPSAQALSQLQTLFAKPLAFELRLEGAPESSPCYLRVFLRDSTRTPDFVGTLRFEDVEKLGRGELKVQDFAFGRVRVEGDATRFMMLVLALAQLR